MSEPKKIDPAILEIGSKALRNAFPEWNNNVDIKSVFYNAETFCPVDPWPEMQNVSSVVIKGLLDSEYVIHRRSRVNFVDDETLESVVNMVLSLEHELLELKGACGDTCKLHKGHSGSCLAKRNN